MSTIAISVVISVTLSTAIAVFMNVKSEKAISNECTKYLSRSNKKKEV